ncbi:MAG: ATP-dependent Clp protease proteolytic subunit [Candidatus Verstraetearchaeota archaeon]|nr:ATP-dependent Clp protease proteolytic subunit [Candidatus Verstraetearchaeota archaeon]
MVDIIGLLFWLLIFVIILWPQLQYRNMQAARMSLIKTLESKLDSRVITMIHRQERIGFFGIPIYRFIDIEDSEAVLRAIRSTPPNKPIALILHTPGGLVLAASQIAEALKRHPAKKLVIIPHYAMSGGTLIALAADEIWMDPNAVLGPLDPQLSIKAGVQLPAPSIVKAVKLKGVDKVSDETLILSDVAEKAIKQIEKMVCELIKDKFGEEKAREIARALAEGRWTHDYPITPEEAMEMGLPVKIGLPSEVYELMELYPQAHIQRPGVEYIPYPYMPPQPRRTERGSSP